MRVTVTWSGIQNAERVTLVTDTLGRVGIFEPPFEDGSLDLFLTETTEFTFTVSNGAGDVVRTAVAEVVPLPRIDEFVVFPSHAESGEPVTISWDVEDAVSVVIEENGQPLPIDPSASSGTYTFTASQPATFRLVATNKAGGTIELSRPFTIGPPQILLFETSKNILGANDAHQLSWATRGGIQLEILENGSLLHSTTAPEEISSGSWVVPARPMDDYVYTLRLQNGLGTTVEREVIVHRTNGPVILSFTLEEDLVCVGEEPVVSWSVTRDAFDVPPNVRVEVAGVSVPLSGAEGSAPLPPLPPGLHALTLIAETPGTRPHSAVLTIEVIDEIVFDRVEVSPPEPEAGTNVTVSWRAVCADSVRLNLGNFAAEPSTSAFQSIASTGTFVTFTSACGTPGIPPEDEGCVDVAFPGGFAFPFDGSTVTTLRVYPNGVATPHLTYTGPTWDHFSPFPGTYYWATFAVFWEDLWEVYSFMPIGVAYKLVGTAPKRSLIIEWIGLTSLYWSVIQGAHLQFQLVLHEDGLFEYRYGNMDNPGDFWVPGSVAIVGYQNLAGTTGLTLVNHSAPPGGMSNRSWRFDFEPRPPVGSHTFRIGDSMDLVFRAFGSDGEVRYVLPIQVQ